MLSMAAGYLWQAPGSPARAWDISAAQSASGMLPPSSRGNALDLGPSSARAHVQAVRAVILSKLHSAEGLAATVCLKAMSAGYLAER